MHDRPGSATQDAAVLLASGDKTKFDPTCLSRLVIFAATVRLSGLRRRRPIAALDNRQLSSRGTISRKEMSEDQHENRPMVGAGAMVLLLIAVPLWSEFRVAGNLVWNIFLALFLLGLAVAAILLQRYFRQHASEIGEAQFDTSNKRNDT
jgi:hypothetical protein